MRSVMIPKMLEVLVWMMASRLLMMIAELVLPYQ